MESTDYTILSKKQYIATVYVRCLKKLVNLMNLIRPEESLQTDPHYVRRYQFVMAEKKRLSFMQGALHFPGGGMDGERWRHILDFGRGLRRGLASSMIRGAML
jgi:hypothetical protein